MSWNWVQWDEDSYVSIGGCALKLVKQNLADGTSCYEVELWCNGNWVFSPKVFKTEEEARAAMMAFIDRCEKL